MSDAFDRSDPAPAPPAPSGSRAPTAEPPYFKGLNDEQRRAVEATKGPVLVLAGAGTGKTRVLTTRLAHILEKGLAHPGQVVAVTFTNKAAREMRHRVAAMTGRPVGDGWWLGTFHALAARILRGHAEAAGLKPNFTILDADDQERLLKQVMEGRDIDDKKWPARKLLGVIQRWKDRGLTPEKVSDEEGGAMADGRLMQLYAAYQDRLRTLNAADFGDLLLHNLTLFAEHRDFLDMYQDQFRYLLVDEYQDTNVAQYLWLRQLARPRNNLCCVGDDDQSIYAWRGAEVGNILKFEKNFPGAKVIRLERNYRSTAHILGAASGLIAHNEGRLGKTLWTGIDAGDKVGVQGVWDGEEEARVICDDVEAKRRDGHSLERMSVLVRAGFQTREFEERLITLGIPYRVIGGPRFYERQECRDAIAYFRVIVSPDDDLAFERIVNVPKRGLGKATLQSIHQLARGQGVSLHDACRMIAGTDELRPKARRTLTALITDFERWRSQLEILDHAELAGVVLDESGYTDMWQKQKNQNPEASGRLENLRELVNGLEEFQNLQGFLEHVSLVMENEDNAADEKLSLMTLHAAKGSEFDIVFLPGWEEGLFPHQRSLDEEGLKGLEEERRLAYVGLTRARRKAHVTYAANRRIYNQWQSALPSRFIDELPEEHVDAMAESGLYGAQPRPVLRETPQAFSFQPAGRTPRRRDGVILDGEAWEIDTAGGDSRFEEGARVFHEKFGYGRVESRDGNKLEVAFDKAGTKKVIDSFVEPA